MGVKTFVVPEDGTLNQAVEILDNRGTIFISEGTHKLKTPVETKKSITIAGYNLYKTSLLFDLEDTAINVDSAEEFSLINLKIERIDNFAYKILNLKSENIKITNCIIKGNSSNENIISGDETDCFGIDVKSSSRCVLQNSVFTEISGTGMVCHSGSIKIDDCNFVSNNCAGLILKNHAKCNIQTSRFLNNKCAGIVTENNVNGRIYANILRNNGIREEEKRNYSYKAMINNICCSEYIGGAVIKDNSKIFFGKNRFVGNNGYAAVFMGNSEGIISNNIFSLNTLGDMLTLDNSSIITK